MGVYTTQNNDEQTSINCVGLKAAFLLKHRAVTTKAVAMSCGSLFLDIGRVLKTLVDNLLRSIGLDLNQKDVYWFNQTN